MKEVDSPKLARTGDPRCALIEKLWRRYGEVARILRSAGDDEAARAGLQTHFCEMEKLLEQHLEHIHPLERDLALECLRVAKTIISLRSEQLTGFKLIEQLRELAGSNGAINSALQMPFLMDFERIMRGCYRDSGIYQNPKIPDYVHLVGQEAARARDKDLDGMGQRAQKSLERYRTGMEDAVRSLRRKNRERILATLGAEEKDWNNWQWQLRNVIRGAEDLARLVAISEEEYRAVEAGVHHSVPFGITPYYVHLMDPMADGDWDRAIRHQVIPPMDYVEQVSAHRRLRESTFDFMQERDTSPCELISRRYPMICIMKPSNTCAQICVYCQRNWEIEGCYLPSAIGSQDEIRAATEYIESHSAISEVLVTGGDPLILSDERLKGILDRLAQIPHLKRIRLGTRMPVVLPMRITDELAELIAGYRDLGRRDICVVTHFQHAYEVTPEAAAAVDRLRRRGLSVYNQAVFTFSNSRRYEMVALRQALGLIGVEQYYTFAPQGKEETNWYRIPIARLMQESKEEARLTPGMWRADHTVFNVPRLGKNYLNRQQDHAVIALLPDGRRVYEFHPWEKKLTLANTYLHRDVSIWDYLNRLQAIGENLQDYASIWYYY